MNDETAVRERYAHMATAALLDAWAQQERLPWAEALLAAELEARGVPDLTLQRLKQDRGSADMSASSARVAEQGDAMLICLAALMGAAALYHIVGGLLDRGAGMLAALAVMLIPVERFGVRLWRRWHRPRGAARSVVLVYQSAVLALFAGMIVAGLVTLSLERMG